MNGLVGLFLGVQLLNIIAGMLGVMLLLGGGMALADGDDRQDRRDERRSTNARPRGLSPGRTGREGQARVQTEEVRDGPRETLMAVNSARV